MPDIVKAVYHQGVFVPQEPYEIPEGLEVELIVKDPLLLSSEIQGAADWSTNPDAGGFA